jgi:hypothetical protein
MAHVELALAIVESVRSIRLKMLKSLVLLALRAWLMPFVDPKVAIELVVGGLALSYPSDVSPRLNPPMFGPNVPIVRLMPLVELRLRSVVVVPAADKSTRLLKTRVVVLDESKLRL